MSCRTRRRRLKNENDFPPLMRNESSTKKDSSPNTDSTTSSQFSTNQDKDVVAVDWWRGRHQDGDINRSYDFSEMRDRIDVMSKGTIEENSQNGTLVDATPFNIVSPFTTTLENAQRDTKGRPYDITRQGSFEKPVAGMVLDPKFLPNETRNEKQLGENPSLGIFQTKGRSDSGRNQIEFFQPQLEPVTRAKQFEWQLPSQNANSSTVPPTKNIMSTVYNCYGDAGDEIGNGSISTNALKNKQAHSQSSQYRDTASREDENYHEVSLSEFNSWMPKASPERAKRISDKNPHTSTHSPRNAIGHINNSCEEINSGAVFGTKNHDNVTKDNEISNEKEDRFVRYNGWAGQDPRGYPFSIFGDEGCDMSPRVFTPSMMETLRGFMPMKLMNHNFWLRFSLARDGTSFGRLLASVRASPYTIIGVETDYGEVFGCFTGSPWRMGSTWYGSSEAFLWRLKEKRYTSARNARKSNFERQMELYHCTEDDEFIQYCTAETIAVGGGEWQNNACPYRDSNQGIGLVIDGDLFGGETNSCATFANPKLARHATISNEFVITNLEVWTLTPCAAVDEAFEKEMREFPARGIEIRLEN